MVYIKNWEEFYSASIDLFVRNPSRTRCVTKYRHTDGKLVVKVTDNDVCLKYKSDQLADVKKAEKLNNSFFRLMTSRDPSSERAAESSSISAPSASSSTAGGSGSAKGKKR